MPAVIAHRGVHNFGITENTMAAFEAAHAAGADMIELDVRRTAAGELAILHDHDFKKVALDSCSLDDFESRTGFRPPLFEEVLEWADGRIGLDVELKEDGYAEQVVPLLVEFAAAGNEVIVTSFIDPLLARLAELAPRCAAGAYPPTPPAPRPSMGNFGPIRTFVEYATPDQKSRYLKDLLGGRKVIRRREGGIAKREVQRAV